MLKYEIKDLTKSLCNDKEPYVMFLFDEKKNLLMIGSHIYNVDFIRRVLLLIDPDCTSEPYLPQRNYIRYNIGMYLTQFLNLIDRLKQNDSIEINKTKKINRLM